MLSIMSGFSVKRSLFWGGVTKKPKGQLWSWPLKVGWKHSASVGYCPHPSNHARLPAFYSLC